MNIPQASHLFDHETPDIMQRETQGMRKYKLPVAEVRLVLISLRYVQTRPQT